MGNFLLENAQRHQSLVKQFVPPPAKQNVEQKPEPAARDLIIATHFRPILGNEISSEHVPAVFTRKTDTSIVDLHELKRVVRGLPTLNVSSTPPLEVIICSFGAHAETISTSKT